MCLHKDVFLGVENGCQMRCKCSGGGVLFLAQAEVPSGAAAAPATVHTRGAAVNLNPHRADRRLGKMNGSRRGLAGLSTRFQLTAFI